MSPNQRPGNFVDKLNSHRPQADSTYSNVINEIAEHGVCPFCPDMLLNYHKKPILINGDHWLATENMYPYKNAREHLLIIHKKHIEDFEQMTSPAWTELKSISNRMVEDRKILGATLIMRFGHTAFNGATVNHLHAQIVSGSGQDSGNPILTRVG